MGLPDVYIDFSFKFACNNDEIDWLKSEFAKRQRRGVVDFNAMFVEGEAWFYSSEVPGYFNAPYHVALFLKRFLFSCRRTGTIGFTYSSCASGGWPLDVFGGGAYFVTAYRIYKHDTWAWLKERSQKFENMRKK